ncbi:MAG: hypothetical protein ACI9A7_000411 [Cyclobacteriaceae bacterium]|jgi:hypothetical protein
MDSAVTFETLIIKLKILYGDFDLSTRQFVKGSNSSIARELGYSDAQFSRLINQHATDGEYQRANQNADRILKLIAYEEKFSKLDVDPSKAFASPRKSLIIFIAGLLISSITVYVLLTLFKSEPPTSSRYDMLKWSFESNFINPYMGLRELPYDCNFECYKYQGRWELQKEYKLPFLRESSGFHYLAKSAIAYIQCVPNDNPEGTLMKGYEYQEHEIWYDILERPIGEFILADGTPMDSYENLRFNEIDDFVMIGTIHTFYTNDFKLDSAGITRQGQDIGRDLELVLGEDLKNQLNNKSLVEKIRREITQIIQDPLLDFSKPSNCGMALKPSSDFNDISSGDEMIYNCQMIMAGRFPIGYTKTYVLVDQFIKDRCISSTK